MSPRWPIAAAAVIGLLIGALAVTSSRPVVVDRPVTVMTTVTRTVTATPPPPITPKPTPAPAPKGSSTK